MTFRAPAGAALVGFAAGALSAAVSIADAAGIMPVVLFDARRAWSPLLRPAGFPIELAAVAWFAAVAAACLTKAGRAGRSTIPFMFITSVPIVSVCLWQLLSRPFVWSVLISTAAAAVILLWSALTSGPWPERLVNAPAVGLRALLSRRRTRWPAIIVALIAIAAAAGLQRVSSIPRDEAFGQDFRRWYLSQPRHQELTGAGDVKVVLFTDYTGLDRYTVAERYRQVEWQRTRQLPVEWEVRDFPQDQPCTFEPRPSTGSCEAAAAVRLVRKHRGEIASAQLAQWLYARGPALTAAIVKRRLEELGLAEAFDASRARLAAEIAADVEVGRRAGVFGTPAYFVNGIQIPAGSRMLVRTLEIERERLGLPAAVAIDGFSATRKARRAVDVISIQHAQRLGSEGAPLILVEFSGFQCAFCGVFSRDVLPELKREFVEPGRVQLAFMHLPLPALQEHGVRAARAAECAAEQGGFWKMHSILFARQEHLEAATLRSHASALKLSLGAFDRCMTQSIGLRVAEGVALAHELDVRGTPTFFLGYRDGVEVVRVVQRFDRVLGVADLREAIAQIEEEAGTRESQETVGR